MDNEDYYKNLESQLGLFKKKNAKQDQKNCNQNVGFSSEADHLHQITEQEAAYSICKHCELTMNFLSHAFSEDEIPTIMRVANNHITAMRRFIDYLPERSKNRVVDHYIIALDSMKKFLYNPGLYRKRCYTHLTKIFNITERIMVK